MVAKTWHTCFRRHDLQYIPLQHVVVQQQRWLADLESSSKTILLTLLECMQHMMHAICLAHRRFPFHLLGHLRHLHALIMNTMLHASIHVEASVVAWYMVRPRLMMTGTEAFEHAFNMLPNTVTDLLSTFLIIGCRRKCMRMYPRPSTNSIAVETRLGSTSSAE